MRTADIPQALQSLKPGAQWVLRGDAFSGLEWLDTEQAAPTEAEVTAEIQRLNAYYASIEYQSKRAAEYPSIGDQLDALFHAGVFPAEMAATIQAVKDKYPKA